MTEYWNTEYTDIFPGITFKVKKINPIEIISLVNASIDFEKETFEHKNEFIKRCLLNIVWSKDGSKYFPLIDSENNPHLPELITNPTIAFDVFYVIRKDVIMPVFTESRTYQNLIDGKNQTSSSK